MIRYTQLYIDGKWQPPAATAAPICVENPYTQQIIGEVPAGSTADVDAAITAAARALPAWRETPIAERSALLASLAAALSAKQEEIAQLITQEVGTPIRISRGIQAALPVKIIHETINALKNFSFSRTINNSEVQYLAGGVAAAITPWNYPLHQIIGKVASALAAGATIVLKPSDTAPLNAYLLATVMHEIGAPAGVFNLVTGPGREIGHALASHPLVSLVSFTGSTAIGNQVAAAAASHTARAALELGGKSPSVLLPDADFPTAVKVSVANAFLNSGQTCTAWSRLVVPREKLAEVEALVTAAVSRYAPGDPQNEATRLGPMVSKAQQNSVLQHIAQAKTDGFTPLIGGAATSDQGRGYFVEPTVFSDVPAASAIAQEEVFGPVLVIQAYDSVAEAIEIANSTKYGLAAGVWSQDSQSAAQVAGQIMAGQVDINGAAFNPAAPFGGMKDSGYGREFGTFGIEEYLVCRSIQK